MKNYNPRYLVLILVSFLFIIGCSDDNEEEATPDFAGNYVISKATTTETFIISSTTIPQIPVPSNTDITPSIQNALLGAVTCSSPEKSYIELREDNTLYLSCEGADALNAGTWEGVSATELKLNMNSAAIASSPSGFVLTVTDVVKTATGIKGTTSVPMPKEMFAEGLEQMGMTIADTPSTYVVPFSLELLEK